MRFSVLISVILFILIFTTSTRAEVLQPVSFDKLWNSPFFVDPQFPHHMINSEGKHLYILNKTAWAYFKCLYPERVLDKALKHGASVIRVCLEGEPYKDELHADLWPWGGTRQQPDWTTFDQQYLNEVERRIRMAGDRGIGIDLVLYFNLVPVVADIPQQRPYWDMVLTRLGRYSNILTFEIMNEETGNEAFQDSLGAYFKRNDPYHHLICSSEGTTDDALWPDKPWMDLAVVHTCTGMQSRFDLQYWYLNIARNIRQHGKPAFNNESGREERHQNDDPIHRRKQAWLFAAAGAFWTWHSWDGCEGINDLDYFAPGWQYLAPMRSFFESLPFWELRPNFTACCLHDSRLIQTTLSVPDRRTTIMYCCTRQSGGEAPPSITHLQQPDGAYAVEYLSPADLHPVGSSRIVSTGLKTVLEITLPEFVDDLLVKIVKIEETE